MDRHDRKELIDRPGIWNRLEDREVADELACQPPLQVLELLGHVLGQFGVLDRPLAHPPEQLLPQTPVFERQVAQVKQREHLVPLLQHVVVVLAVVLAGDAGVEIVHLLNHLRLALEVAHPDRAVRQGQLAHHVKDQHRMRSGDHAAVLSEHDRLAHVLTLAHLLDRVDDVVGVFLHGVVDARLRGGTRAVIVDAQSPTDIEVVEVRAELAQLGVRPRRFLDRVFDPLDVGHLRADVKV